MQWRENVEGVQNNAVFSTPGKQTRSSQNSIGRILNNVQEDSSSETSESDEEVVVRQWYAMDVSTSDDE